MRAAVRDDIPRMVDMGRRFFGRSGLGAWFSFDGAAFGEQIARLMDHDDALVLVTDNGMAAAFAYPCWFGRQKVAQEVFWWSEGGDGMAMLRAMEDWARERGCATFEMGALDDLAADRLGRFYARRGYAPKERLFVRSL